MTGLSWSEHVRLEATAEWAATQEAAGRLQVRRDRRRRAFRWLNLLRQFASEPAAAAIAPGASRPVPGAVPGTSGAAPNPSAHGPPGRTPIGAPNVPPTNE